MKLGLMFVNSGPFSNPDLLGHLAQKAEECGFESLWTVEHVVIPKGFQTPYPYSKDGKIPGGDNVRDSGPAAAPALLPQPSREDPACHWRRDPAAAPSLVHGEGDGDARSAFCGVEQFWASDRAGSKRSSKRSVSTSIARGARTDEAIKSMRALWRDKSSSFHGKHFDFGPVLAFLSLRKRVACRYTSAATRQPRHVARAGLAMAFSRAQRHPEAQPIVCPDARRRRIRPDGTPTDRTLLRGTREPRFGQSVCRYWHFARRGRAPGLSIRRI